MAQDRGRVHPEFHYEEAVLATAFDMVQRALDRAPRAAGADAHTELALRRHFRDRDNEIGLLLDRLYVGRLIATDPSDPFGLLDIYIGLQPQTILDGRDCIRIVNWQATAARPFYTLSGGIRLKRTLGVSRRSLATVTDDVDVRSEESNYEVDRSAALRVHLRSMPSSPFLGDIVATIQPDQYALIEADPATCHIIQGCAGSGKSSIGLHRLSYLMFHFSGSGVQRTPNYLFIAPNASFVKYIGNVLPTLGIPSVRTETFRQFSEAVWNRSGVAMDFASEALRIRHGSPRPSTTARADTDAVLAHLKWCGSLAMGTLVDCHAAYLRDRLDLPVKFETMSGLVTIPGRKPFTVTVTVSRDDLDAAVLETLDKPLGAVPDARVASIERILTSQFSERRCDDAVRCVDAIERALTLVRDNVDQTIGLDARRPSLILKILRRRPEPHPVNLRDKFRHAADSVAATRLAIQAARATSREPDLSGLTSVASGLQTAIKSIIGPVRERAEPPAVTARRSVDDPPSSVQLGSLDLAASEATDRFPVITLEQVKRRGTEITAIASAAAERAWAGEFVRCGFSRPGSGNGWTFSAMTAVAKLIGSHAVLEEVVAWGEAAGMPVSPSVVEPFAAALPLGGIDADHTAAIHLLHLVANRPRIIPLDHLVVDEAQELSDMEFLVLTRHVSARTGLTIVGDLSQGIRAVSGAKSWDAVAQCIERPDAIVTTLDTSYRSSANIVAVGNGLIDRMVSLGASRTRTVAIKDAGPPVALSEFGDDTEQLHHILRMIDALEGSVQNIAILTPSRSRAMSVAFAMDGLVRNLRVRAMFDDHDLYEGGLVVMPVHLAKGLEFEVVVVTDCDAWTYPDTLESCQLLYVACTRAIRVLELTFTGRPTSLLVHVPR